MCTLPSDMVRIKRDYLQESTSLKRSTEKFAGENDLSWEELDRKDWHLWILAMLLIFILGIGLLSFMFPSAYWFGDDLAMKSPQRAFLGFCVLLGLVMVYLMQRQFVVRGLKQQLFRANRAAAEAEHLAFRQAFLALPGADVFRDALAMDYRRSCSSGTSLVTVVVNAADSEILLLARTIGQMLRRGETLYRIDNQTLAVILPNLQSESAYAFISQAENLSGIVSPNLKVTVAAYPEQATSLREMEQTLAKSRSDGTPPIEGRSDLLNV